MDESPFGYVQDGVSDVANGAQFGMSHFANDMARLGSAIQPIAYSPQSQAAYQHHGMVMYEMGTMGALGAASGQTDAPRYMSQTEWQQAGAETLAQNMASTAVYGGILGTSGFGLAGLGMAVPFTRLGRGAFRYGARNIMGAGGQMAQRGLRSWAFQGARAGSLAARAGGLATGMGLSASTGISAAAGIGGVAMAGGALFASMAPFMLADAAVSQVVDIARERSEISDYIQSSSFRYASPSQWTSADVFGGGYGRKAAGRIAERIMQYEAQNPQYDLGELKGILQKGTQIGIFSSTRDATDFQNRFKETADALKTVTKVLHTSLSEGLDTIKALRDVGVTGTAAQTSMINRSDIIGLASGKTASEMFTIGLQGAQMLRGTGINMSAGVEANQAMYAQLVNMQKQGTITSEQVAQMGGMEAFSQSMVAGTIRAAQSPMGRAMMMATTTGGVFDPAKLAAIASGKVDYRTALYDASRAAQDPMNFMNMQVNQENNIASMMKSFGGTGAQIAQLTQAMMVSQEYLRTSGQEATVENQDRAMRFFLRRSGNDAASTDAMMGLLKDPSDLQRNLEAATRQNTQKTVLEAYTQKYGIGNQFVRDYRSVMHSTVGAAGISVGRAIDRITEGVTGWYNESILGMPAQANVDYGVLDQSNNYAAFASPVAALPGVAPAGRAAAVWGASAGLGTAGTPFQNTAIGAAGGALMLGAATIASGGTILPLVAMAAGGAALGGGIGFGASALEILRGRMTSVGDAALARGEFSANDFVAEGTPGAVKIGDKWVSKEAQDRVSSKYSGRLLVSEEALTSGAAGNMGPLATKALMAANSKTISDSERMDIIAADRDVSILSDAKQKEYTNLTDFAAKEKFFSRLSLGDLSKTGLSRYFSTYATRGELEAGKLHLAVARGIGGRDVKELGDAQKELGAANKEVEEQLGLAVNSGMRLLGAGDRSTATDALLSDPATAQALRDLNGTDPDKVNSAKAKIQTKLGGLDLGDIRTDLLADGIQESVQQSASLKEAANKQQFLHKEVQSMTMEQLANNFNKNLDEVSTAANVSESSKTIIRSGIHAQFAAISGEGGVDAAIQSASTISSELRKTGLDEKLPLLATGQRLIANIKNASEKEIAQATGMTEKDVQSAKAKGDAGYADIIKRVGIKSQQDAGVVGKAAEDSADASLRGITDVAEALKVIRTQTEAVKDLVQALTGMSTNIRNRASLAHVPFGG